MEEQGRKTLHAHILVYVEGWSDIVAQLHHGSEKRRLLAEQEVRAFVDRVISTELAPGQDEVVTCPECGGSLECVEEQQMRHLRHRFGSQFEKGIFVKCPDCKKGFQADEFATKRVLDRPQWDKDQAVRKAVVMAEVLSDTVPGGEVTNRGLALVNYLFNHHLGFHTKTCFKKGDEGRCMIPDIAESETRVLYSAQECELYSWNGQMVPTKNVTVRPRRLPQDAHTNAHCGAISASKAPSNSNAQVTTGARASIYTSCYAAKKTQKEDTGEPAQCGTLRCESIQGGAEG